MITKKELGYVNLWANKVPYPGQNYCEEAMEKLTRSFDMYLTDYQGKKYNITFSNNEEIEFEILSKNICHMLGIDHNNLSGDYFKAFRKDVLNYNPDDSISAFELLKLIIQNKEKVMRFDYDNAKKNNNTRVINYYKSSIKCDIFNKMANLSDFNYGCINFSKEKYNNIYPNLPFSSNSIKFLYTPSNEVISPYYMMGIKIDEGQSKTITFNEEESDTYIVETLMAPENFINIFNDQEVVIPTQILVDNNSELDKLKATNEDKIKLLREYRAIINEYKLSDRMNIYGDYLSLLMDSDRASKAKALVKKD
jgi:hypothetical protein